MGAVCVTNSSLLQSRYNCDLNLTVGRERQAPGGAPPLASSPTDTTPTTPSGVPPIASTAASNAVNDMRVQTVRTTP